MDLQMGSFSENEPIWEGFQMSNRRQAGRFQIKLTAARRQSPSLGTVDVAEWRHAVATIGNDDRRTATLAVRLVVRAVVDYKPRHGTSLGAVANSVHSWGKGGGLFL